MRTHSEIGAQILEGSQGELLQMAARIARCHHEKWNGGGYPAGLAGEAIPLEARMVAIADVFDALTSVRPYKSAWSFEDAMQLIRSESGQHFDPVLVEHFLKLEQKIKEIQKRWAD